MSQLSKTAVDAEGGGDCVFGAVSQQLYGNPKNYFYVHSGGIHYLVNHPEQFIEHSWQGNLERTSYQGTWADAIIIQAVANFLNLSNIAVSNPTYFPVTVVEPVDVTNALDLYKNRKPRNSNKSGK